MTGVSRDVMRAILETRDYRHNETHAVLLALYQGLVAELVEQGVLAPEPLAERLSLVASGIDVGPYGTAARNMLEHVLTWLHAMQPDLPPAHPERWHAPAPSQENQGDEEV